MRRREEEGWGWKRKVAEEGRDECRYVSFVVATKGPPGGFANRNRRPWSVYEFPQLATGDKQIASYFCIQRLNGRRVWNDAPARYKRPLLVNTGGERHTLEEFQRVIIAQAEFDFFLSLSRRLARRAVNIRTEERRLERGEEPQS